MEIKKAKILKSKKDAGVRTLTVEYVTTDKEGKEDYHADECGGHIHPDLYNAFQLLAIHFGLILEIIDDSEVVNTLKYDPELTSRIVITSFSVGGKDEDPGLTISGYKILRSGKIFTTSTPLTKFDQGEDGYDHIDNLISALDSAKSEVRKYLEGKYADDPQLDLFDDKSKTVVEVLEPEEGSAFESEKPKRGRKKKEVVTE